VEDRFAQRLAMNVRKIQREGGDALPLLLDVLENNFNCGEAVRAYRLNHTEPALVLSERAEAILDRW
jgi:hypothetical protein